MATITTLTSIIDQEQYWLFRYLYKREKNINAELASAITNGNDTVYLRRLSINIEKEIQMLRRQNEHFAKQRIPNIYKKAQKRIETELKDLPNKELLGSFGNINKEALKVLAQNTYDSLDNIAVAIGRRSEGFLRKVALEATGDIVSGAKSWQQASRELRNELIKNKETYIMYKNGTEVKARHYAKMVARTTSAQAYRKGTEERLKGYGYDLVKVIGTSVYPNSPCIPFEGQVLSITGETQGYTSLAEAESQGLFHPNCIHDIGYSEENEKL